MIGEPKDEHSSTGLLSFFCGFPALLIITILGEKKTLLSTFEFIKRTIYFDYRDGRLRPLVEPLTLVYLVLFVIEELMMTERSLQILPCVSAHEENTCSLALISSSAIQRLAMSPSIYSIIWSVIIGISLACNGPSSMSVLASIFKSVYVIFDRSQTGVFMPFMCCLTNHVDLIDEIWTRCSIHFPKTHPTE